MIYIAFIILVNILSKLLVIKYLYNNIMFLYLLIIV